VVLEAGQQLRTAPVHSVSWPTGEGNPKAVPAHAKPLPLHAVIEHGPGAVLATARSVSGVVHPFGPAVRVARVEVCCLPEQSIDDRNGCRGHLPGFGSDGHPEHIGASWFRLSGEPDPVTAADLSQEADVVVVRRLVERQHRGRERRNRGSDAALVIHHAPGRPPRSLTMARVVHRHASTAHARAPEFVATIRLMRRLPHRAVGRGSERSICNNSSESASGAVTMASWLVASS
jgi:hypothetical protein